MYCVGFPVLEILRAKWAVYMVFSQVIIKVSDICEGVYTQITFYTVSFRHVLLQITLCCSQSDYPLLLGFSLTCHTQCMEMLVGYSHDFLGVFPKILQY